MVSMFATYGLRQSQCINICRAANVFGKLNPKLDDLHQVRRVHAVIASLFDCPALLETTFSNRVVRLVPFLQGVFAYQGRVAWHDNLAHRPDGIYQLYATCFYILHNL